jgi:hypothetical protein
MSNEAQRREAVREANYHSYHKGKLPQLGPGLALVVQTGHIDLM